MGEDKSNALDCQQLIPLQKVLKDQDTDCLQFDAFQKDCQVQNARLALVLILAIFPHNLTSSEMINTVDPFIHALSFLWFQLPTVNCGGKILNGNFQK